MDGLPDDNLASGTETTGKQAKVTPALFYKRGSAARPAAKSHASSSGHTHHHIQEKNKTATTSAATVALNVSQSVRHQEGEENKKQGSQSDMDIMHLSTPLQGVDIGSIEEEVPLDFIHDVSSPEQYQSPVSPLLFTTDLPESSPPSSSGSLVVMDTPPSHSSSATVPSTRPPASKSNPLLQNAPSAQPGSSSSRKSKVWEHFSIVGDGRSAKCKLCGREVSRGRVIGHLTNSGMNHHLRTHHKPVLLREDSGLLSPPPSKKRASASSSATISSHNLDKGHRGEAVDPSQAKQPTLDQFSGFHSRGISRQQSRKITRLIGELIAVGGAPFNMVEGEPFKRLMQAVAPQYVIPSRTTFSRSIVPSLHKSCVELIKQELGRATGQSVHFTTDLWSAPSGQHAFLSLTAHWWQPIVMEPAQITSGPRSTGAGVVEKQNQGHCSFLLHAEVLDEQHSSHNITRALQKMVAEWLGEQANTQAKMGFVVTDGAANMLKALRDGKFVGVRCSAHVLHLVVKAGIDDTTESNTKLSEVLDSCRKIAGHFHRSVKDSHIFRQEQIKAGLPQHRLKQDVSTRWNSTLDMLERILEQQKAIHAMSHEHVIGVARPLSREEWKIISQVVTVLSPFRAATENLSQENASLAQDIPLFSHLVNKMDAILNHRENLPRGYLVPDIATLVRRINRQLNRRIKELTDACPELMLATMCDPRIKGKMALQANSLTSWREKLTGCVTGEDTWLCRQRETMKKRRMSLLQCHHHPSPSC
ncbi:zinc finger BED domain-containing protein 4-like [Hyla sarda]|uniref:zinc finger BED domain-containing protein 4-like n=1 Tax=Hyla sarda TaxID=327740 RepID=UPI0024C2F890|nr:zinc finger BED domain-containing protein 4-like [Hyla sarda]